MATTTGEAKFSYMQVANALRADIALGQLKPGERLPSIRDLAERFGIAPQTVQNGLAVLRDQGLIYAGSTRGYFVTNNAAEELKEKPIPQLVAVNARLDELTALVEALKERVAEIEANARQ